MTHARCCCGDVCDTVFGFSLRFNRSRLSTTKKVVDELFRSPTINGTDTDETDLVFEIGPSIISFTVPDQLVQNRALASRCTAELLTENPPRISGIIKERAHSSGIVGSITYEGTRETERRLRSLKAVVAETTVEIVDGVIVKKLGRLWFEIEYVGRRREWDQDDDGPPSEWDDIGVGTVNIDMLAEVGVGSELEGTVPIGCVPFTFSPSSDDDSIGLAYGAGNVGGDGDRRVITPSINVAINPTGSPSVRGGIRDWSFIDGAPPTIFEASTLGASYAFTPRSFSLRADGIEGSGQYNTVDVSSTLDSQISGVIVGENTVVGRCHRITPTAPAPGGSGSTRPGGGGITPSVGGTGAGAGLVRNTFGEIPEDFDPELEAEILKNGGGGCGCDPPAGI